MKYVTRISSEKNDVSENRILVKILILYSDFTYEYVDLDGGWYRKPNDEKTDLSRGYECKDFIEYLDYQKCRYKKMTREETIMYLRTKEGEFQKNEEAVHIVWTYEESRNRRRGIFDLRPLDDDKPEYHYKKNES